MPVFYSLVFLYIILVPATSPTPIAKAAVSAGSGGYWKSASETESKL